MGADVVNGGYQVSTPNEAKAVTVGAGNAQRDSLVDILDSSHCLEAMLGHREAWLVSIVCGLREPDPQRLSNAN